ncbi:amidohydrolase family protein [Sphingomonas sp. SUN039]|uniref:amidohydrolase family protein n=1 Tax=Sphingomonas sp. SUN039 TaxID=2937787 RepID=UPI0021649D50|nr:amidohydrolase family protein [Sphingomonas sp. SUN039]UVO53769.1 amidohydrolase family protein [Sphingomonas sp. SUN039]
MFRSRKTRVLLLVGVICLIAIMTALVWPSTPQRPVTKMLIAGRLRIDGVIVVDPRDGTLHPEMTVEMTAGRITRVAKADTLSIDPKVQRIDGRGKFIVPGFNDMHHHSVDADDPSGDLALMLAEGVTGFRQMSGSDSLLQERRENRLPLTRLAPQLLAMPGAVLTPFNAGSPEAARAEVNKQKAEGADFIKIGLVPPDVFWAALAEAKKVGLPAVGHLQVGVDPVRASREGFRSIEHLGPGAPIWIACSKNREALFAEAAAHPAIKAPPFHIPFLEAIVAWRFRTIGVNPAAFASPDDIARLQRALDSYDASRCRALAEQFRRNNSWQVPTLVRLRTQQLADDPAYQVDPSLRYMPQENIDRWRGVLERFKGLPAPMLATLRSAYARNLALTKLFSDAGVPMMAGTDFGGLASPGMTLQLEFVELARAGISPLKVLQMTTTNPAIFLGRTKSMGLVADGYDADLVLLDANPLDSVGNLRSIAGVVRAGYYYSAADLNILRDRIARRRGTLK